MSNASCVIIWKVRSSARKFRHARIPGSAAYDRAPSSTPRSDDLRDICVPRDTAPSASRKPLSASAKLAPASPRHRVETDQLELGQLAIKLALQFCGPGEPARLSGEQHTARTSSALGDISKPQYDSEATSRP